MHEAKHPPMDTHNDIDAALTRLPGWEQRERALYRTYCFPDFVTAFGWMAQVALVAERLDHHPEWRNVWNRVEVVLTTHDAGGVTAKDLALAEAMERLAAPLLK